jgi:hypothetical protein
MFIYRNFPLPRSRIPAIPLQYQVRPTRINRKHHFRGAYPQRWTRIYCKPITEIQINLS